MASVQQTTNVAIPLTSGLAIAMWAVAPTWPPPESVLVLVVGMLSPIAHLVGRAVYNRVAVWAGEPPLPQDEAPVSTNPPTTPAAPVPAAAPTPAPPPQPTVFPAASQPA